MAHKSPPRRGGSTSLERLAPFEGDCVLVVIETSKGSPNKLEPRYGTFVLKGVLPAGAVFPFDSVSFLRRVPMTAIRWMYRLDGRPRVAAALGPAGSCRRRTPCVSPQRSRGPSSRCDCAVRIAAPSSSLGCTRQMR